MRAFSSMGNHRTVLTGIALIGTTLLSCPFGAEATGQDLSGKKAVKGIDAGLDKSAKELTRFLSDPAFREFVWNEMQASRDLEKIVDFKETLTRAASITDLSVVDPNALLQQADAAGAIEKQMKAAGFQDDLTGIDLYFPVDSHRQAWRGEDDLIVAFTPTQDESEVKAIDAYVVKTGEHVVLDPNKPPETPTLLVAIREESRCSSGLSLTPLAPLPQDTDPPPEGVTVPPVTSVINNESHSFIGIPWLRLLDDQEPWWKGDPEIYVLAGQSFKTTPFESKISLPQVNDEDRWYDLGESPSGPLYFFFDENYSDVTQFRFMESDGGSGATITAEVEFQGVTVGLKWPVGDDDDSLGARAVNKNQVGEIGYQRLTTGLVDFLLDRDP